MPNASPKDLGWARTEGLLKVQGLGKTGGAA